MKIFASGLACLVVIKSLARAYSLSREYIGQDFIDEFEFWDDAVNNDPTGRSWAPSAAWYMPRDAAASQNLVWVNDERHFGMSVDSTYTYSGTNLRPSVRIFSKDPVHHGLLILDAVHLPYGNGTWPAFWLSGADGNWPYSGEIDIIEGIGNNVSNTVSYHTGPNTCFYDTSQSQTGVLNTKAGMDCNALENDDSACSSIDPGASSYGSAANSVEGGVWAIEWTSRYIKTWHFTRENIPVDISNGQPNPRGWGTPVTNLASTNCNIDASFGPQSIIFNIELCGTWEGTNFDGGPQACIEYVQSNPDAFKTAFFEILSLRYYR